MPDPSEILAEVRDKASTGPESEETGQPDAVPPETETGDVEAEPEGGEKDKETTTAQSPTAEPGKADAEGLASDEVKTEPEPEPKVTPVLDALNAAGMKHDFGTDEDAIRSYGDLRSKIGERNELAEIGRQALPVWPKVQESIEAAKKPEPETPAFDVPEVHEADMLELQKPKEEQNPDAVRRVGAAVNYVNEKWQRWMWDPYAHVQEMVMPAVREMLDTEFTRRQNEADIRTFVGKNEDFMKQNEQELKHLVGMRNLPIEEATELVRLRHKSGVVAGRETAAQAKTADVERLASKGQRARPSGPSARLAEQSKAGPTDWRAIAKEARENDGLGAVESGLID